MTDEIKEYSVADYPGWTRLEIKSDTGSSRQYRHDSSGRTISNRQFVKLRNLFKGGYVPEEYIQVVSGNALPQFASSKRNPPIGIVNSTATPGAATPLAEEYEEEELVQTIEQPQLSNTSSTSHRVTPHQKRLLGTRPTPGGRKTAFPHPNNAIPISPPPEPVAQQPANILDNIEPKSHPSKPGRKIENGATAKELSDGLYISLSIVTSLVAMLTKTPDLAIACFCS